MDVFFMGEKTKTKKPMINCYTFHQTLYLQKKKVIKRTQTQTHSQQNMSMRVNYDESNRNLINKDTFTEN